MNSYENMLVPRMDFNTKKLKTWAYISVLTHIMRKMIAEYDDITDGEITISMSELWEECADILAHVPRRRTCKRQLMKALGYLQKCDAIEVVSSDKDEVVIKWTAFDDESRRE